MYRTDELNSNGSIKETNVYYDNPLEILDTVPASTQNRRLLDSIWSRGSQSWWGWKDGFNGLKERMTHGWPEAVELIRSQLEPMLELLPQARSVRRRKVNGPIGDSIDIHRVYSGDLDRAWQTTKREMSSGVGNNNVIIVVAIAANSHVEAYQAMWRGYAAAALAERLVESGRSVQVIAIAGSTRNIIQRDPNRACTFSFLIKDFSSPLDIENLLVMTSTGFFRGLALGAYCQLDEVVEDHLGPANYHPRLPEYLVGAGRVLYIPGDTLSCEKAIQVINNCLLEV